MSSRPAIPAIAVLTAAALLPLLFDLSNTVLHNMVLAAAYAVMALGLNLIVGFAGLLDLGYVAFFAIGAYTAAYVASGFWDIHPTSPWSPSRSGRSSARSSTTAVRSPCSAGR